MSITFKTVFNTDNIIAALKDGNDYKMNFFDMPPYIICATYIRQHIQPVGGFSAKSYIKGAKKLFFGSIDGYNIAEYRDYCEHLAWRTFMMTGVVCGIRNVRQYCKVTEKYDIVQDIIVDGNVVGEFINDQLRFLTIESNVIN